MRLSLAVPFVVVLLTAACASQGPLPPSEKYEDRAPPDEPLVKQHLGLGGQTSCFAFMNDDAVRVEGTAWIYGYWTGRNTARNSLLGEGLSQDHIINEVKKECSRISGGTISLAAARVYESILASAPK